MNEELKWKKRFEKERKIRKEAERLLEEKSLELYSLNNALENQKSELETIFQTAIDGIAILDLKTNFIFFNEAYEKISGYSKDELLSKSCIELSDKKDVEKTKQAMDYVLQYGYLDSFEKSCIRKDGEKLIINMSIALMPDKRSFLINAKDMTEMKKKEKEIKNYINLIDENIITLSTNLRGVITYVSNAFCRISGYEKSEIIGKRHIIINHSDMPISLLKSIWRKVKIGQNWEGELKQKRKDNKHFWVESSISAIFDSSGKKTGYISISQDITDKKMIELLSITDSLTGIYNRRYFEEMFPKLINLAKRESTLISFLIIDIDHFKQYNDTYGHQMGDEALIKVATALKKSLNRVDDYCFRLGGEEFGVIYRSKSSENSLIFANRIKQNIENLKIEHKSNSASDYITISSGLITKNPANQIDKDIVYKDADNLLYKAKELGRNRVCYI
jgi:diguanylate cyclase (GGDEF)-like protein/PAS domain S-box-containing protein